MRRRGPYPTLIVAVRAALPVLLLAVGSLNTYIRPVGGWTLGAQPQQQRPLRMLGSHHHIAARSAVHSKGSAREGRARVRVLPSLSLSSTVSAADSSSSEAVSPPEPAIMMHDNGNGNYYKRPLLNFALPDTVDVVDRLDDAIMGGISTSAVVHSSSSTSSASGCAKWFGVCREDGGGFCGWRTNPFKAALNVSKDDGLYVTARLSSDDDLHRRVWKVSTRTRPDRGEQLYQAPLLWPSEANIEGWRTVRVPFESFRLVRGPRIVPDGPPLDVSGGIYQIGMTMGKFKFGGGETGIDANANGTAAAAAAAAVVRSTLEDFRPGFFQLDLKEIGAYRTVSEPAQDYDNEQGAAVETTTNAAATSTLAAPSHDVILTKAEAQKARPVWIRLLAPVLKLVFLSESRQRRKSALRLLQQRYQWNAVQAVRFVLRQRARSVGYPRAVGRAARIAAEEVVRCVVGLPLRVALLYPIRLFGKLTRRRDSSSRKPKKELASSQP
jgi:Complex I intermediate-associated protein 30 (CIA30)